MSTEALKRGGRSARSRITSGLHRPSRCYGMTRVNRLFVSDPTDLMAMIQPPVTTEYTHKEWHLPPSTDMGFLCSSKWLPQSPVRHLGTARVIWLPKEQNTGRHYCTPTPSHTCARDVSLGARGVHCLISVRYRTLARLLAGRLIV